MREDDKVSGDSPAGSIPLREVDIISLMWMVRPYFPEGVDFLRPGKISIHFKSPARINVFVGTLMRNFRLIEERDILYITTYDHDTERFGVKISRDKNGLVNLKTILIIEALLRKYEITRLMIKF